jgi:hypothetical protein
VLSKDVVVTASYLRELRLMSLVRLFCDAEDVVTIELVTAADGRGEIR